MSKPGANGLTYAQAGVDIDAGNAMVDQIKPLVRATRRPGADAEIGGFLHRLDRLVDAHAVDAGHRGDGIDDAVARNEEDRPDQVVGGQPVFLHHAPRPVGLAVAPHPPMPRDLVHQMSLVLHDRLCSHSVRRTVTDGCLDALYTG